MGEEKKFNFVYERRAQEDNEFIKSFKIYGEYHYIDITRFSQHWVTDRKKGMYLIYNDAPNALINEGVKGGTFINFIYKNQVCWIEYEEHYDWNIKVEYIKFLKVEIPKNLADEKEYLFEAIKEAIRVKFEEDGYNVKCVFLNEIEKIYYI